MYEVHSSTYSSSFRLHAKIRASGDLVPEQATEPEQSDGSGSISRNHEPSDRVILRVMAPQGVETSPGWAGGPMLGTCLLE